MVDLSTIGGGQRPGRTQGNRNINMPKFIQNLTPLPQDKTPSINLDTSGIYSGGVAKGLESVSEAIGDLAEQDRLKRKSLYEASLKISDKQDKNLVNELADETEKLINDKFNNAKSSVDFSAKGETSKFFDSIGTDIEDALTDKRLSNISELYMLEHQDRIRAMHIKLKDSVNAYTLTSINKKGEDRVNLRSAQLGDEDTVDRQMAMGGDNVLFYLNSFKKIATDAIGTVDLLKAESFQLGAVQNAQDAIFNHYMRNGDLDAAEETLGDWRFDDVDGSEQNLANRKRLRESRVSDWKEVWSVKDRRNIFVRESEINNDLHKPKKDMKKIDNMNQFSRAMLENDTLGKDHPDYENPDDIRKNYNIEETLSEVEKDLLAIEELTEGMENPEEKKAMKKNMRDKLLVKYAPRSAVETAEDEAVATAAKLKKGLEIIARQKEEKIENDAYLAALEKEFTPPVAAVEEKFTNATRRILNTIVSGKMFKPGDFPVLDKVQKEIFNRLGTATEAYKKANPGAGPWESVNAAIEAEKKKDPSFLIRNVFLNMADAILNRRKFEAEGIGTEGGMPAAGPVSQPIPNAEYNADDLNQELQELLKTQKGIDVENATGIGSAFSSFLSNIPGQLFKSLRDPETILARSALLRVSREILTLTMKNDRFAIAEQRILAGLLEGPKALTDASSVKVKLLRFQEELKIEIARSYRDIKAGINADENLDKIIDYDRIDTMIDQFNLTPPIDTATAEDILESSNEEFDDISDTVTNAQLRKMLLEQEEKFNAMAARQQKIMEDLNIGGAGKTVEGDTGDKGVTSDTIKIVGDKKPPETTGKSTPPALVKSLQDLDTEQLNEYANDLADMIAAGNGTPNMEALLRDIEAIIKTDPDFNQ